MFQISECKEKDRVKFAMATLRGRALTWWNGRTKAMGIEAANNTPWSEVRKWMTEEFCPWSVIQRMEQELYNLRMKWMDIDGYTNRFHELALRCPRMVEPEAVKVEQYIRGLTKSIRGDVTSSQPATIYDTVRLAYQLAGQLIQDKADEATEGEKRKGKSDRGSRGDNRREHNRRQNQGRDTSYEVELADGKIVSTNNVLKGCTLNLLNHSFPIDLMVIELRSFDVIIGMDWLSKNDAAILCGEKKVRIPLKNKALIIEGDRNQSCLKIISCIKARKYIENGCELFLAQVTGMVSKEKRVEDVLVIRDFPEVFLEDLPGLPPPRQVEFRIDRLPGATPVARAPYRLAPSELMELSLQLKEQSKKEEAFQTLMRKLCSAPILSLPKGSEHFVVYCDASLRGFGAVLMQREKANVVADVLSRKDKEPIRVRALVVTVHNNLPEQIRNAQAEACKKENIGAEGFVCEGEPFEVRADGTKCLRG
nr:reverse transcriptase domain-containing protein [Tanacetum cinerariifolium]